MPFGDRVSQLPVGSGENTGVGARRAPATKTRILSVLEYVKQFRLQVRAHFPDFIEQYGAFVGEFEFPRLLRHGPRECSALVSEKFGFQ